MNFYLLYSDDKLAIEIEIDKIKNSLNILDDSVSRYSIDMTSLILEDAMTVSMFSLNKIIIVDATSYFSDKKDIDITDIEDYFNSYNKNSYLIFICNSSSIDMRKKLVKLITSNGKVEKIDIDDNYLKNYIKSNLDDYKISDKDISYLISRTNDNISNIDNEIEKLKLYKIDDKVITYDDITLLVDENIDDSIYDFVNAILKKDNNKALKLYNHFILNGMDINQIIPIVASQIRLLFQVKRLYNSGKSNDEIAKTLEFKNVYRVKYLLSDAYYYSEEDLLKYLRRLYEIDYNIKMGIADGKVMFELFMTEKDM